MSKAKIRIPTPLRSLTGGSDEVEVEGETVKQALEKLGEKHEGLLPKVLDANGKVRSFVNIYLGSRNIKALGGLDAEVKEGDILAIVPAVAGGHD
jgi:molybdopterin converting factor small subunit